MEKFCKYVEIPLPDYSVDRWASWKLYQLLINLLEFFLLYTPVQGNIISHLCGRSL